MIHYLDFNGKFEIWKVSTWKIHEKSNKKFITILQGNFWKIHFQLKLYIKIFFRNTLEIPQICINWGKSMKKNENSTENFFGHTLFYKKFEKPIQIGWTVQIQFKISLSTLIIHFSIKIMSHLQKKFYANPRDQKFFTWNF